MVGAVGIMTDGDGGAADLGGVEDGLVESGTGAVGELGDTWMEAAEGFESEEMPSRCSNCEHPAGAGMLLELSR